MAKSTVRQQVWNGKIPIRITVGEPESIGTQVYLISASRVSYLWLYLSDALQYFGKYLEQPAQAERENDSWWFEFESEPVSFNRPIGLLHDLMVGMPSSEPWDLVLRRGVFPSNIILPFNETDSPLRSYWMNQFKESCYVRDGNARAVMALSVKDQESLWQSIIDSTDPKLDTSNTFWQLASSLFKRQNSSTGNVPVRFYLRSEKPHKAIQKIISMSQTLGDVLKSEELSRDQPQEALLHGIIISETVEISHLYYLCTYPDGFLHIVLNPKRSAEFSNIP